MTVTTYPKSEVPLALRAKAELERRKRIARKTWPAEYANRVTGKVYHPHNDDERVFVYDDVPRYSLLIGGEGSGKSSASLIKMFGRLRRGMEGVCASPDLPHFALVLPTPTLAQHVVQAATGRQSVWRPRAPAG